MMRAATVSTVLAACVLLLPVQSRAQVEILTHPGNETNVPADTYFTLSGTVSLDLLTEVTATGFEENGLARTAIVRCWICTDMTCGEDGFGPAWYLRDIEGEQHVEFEFTAYFDAWEPIDVMTGLGNGPNPLDIHSYYCNLRLSPYLYHQVYDMGGAAVVEPSYTYPQDDPTTRWAKAAEGSTLVVELSGPIN